MNWLDDGGTVIAFRRKCGGINGYGAQIRSDFLDRWSSFLDAHRSTKDRYWPFVHGSVFTQNAWSPKSGENEHWPLDPLVIPLLKWMNTMRRLTTTSSCQGDAAWSPSIQFHAPLETVQQLQAEFEQWQFKHRTYERNVILHLHSAIKLFSGNPVWHLWFYDTLALMQFNEEVLGVSIEQQIAVEPDFCDVDIYRRGPLSPEQPTADQIRQAIRQ